MSYEGYREHLCAVGHHWQCDAYFDSPICPYCSGQAVCQNEVDLTNGCCGGQWELEVDCPALTHTCVCGNVHQATAPTYKLNPKKSPYAEQPEEGYTINGEDDD